jgi:hypothetical protein
MTRDKVLSACYAQINNKRHQHRFIIQRMDMYLCVTRFTHHLPPFQNIPTLPQWRCTRPSSLFHILAGSKRDANSGIYNMHHGRDNLWAHSVQRTNRRLDHKAGCFKMHSTHLHKWIFQGKVLMKNEDEHHLNFPVIT